MSEAFVSRAEYEELLAEHRNVKKLAVTLMFTLHQITKGKLACQQLKPGHEHERPEIELPFSQMPDYRLVEDSKKFSRLVDMSGTALKH